MATTSVEELKPRARLLSVSPDTLRWIVAVVGVLAMWVLWHASSRTVQVSVDGITVSVNTHRREVRELLVDLGVDLHANDRVSPAPDTLLSQANGVVVERARPIQVVVDGQTIQTTSWGPTPRAVLLDASVLVDSYDQIMVGDKLLGLDDPLPAREAVVTFSRFAPVRPWARTEVEPLQVRVVRAVPIVVDDVGLPFVVRTTARTVGEALRQAQITIYLGDRVVPSLGSEVSTGLRVKIERSVPVLLKADGRTFKTRTQGDSVADALSEMRIGVSGMDRVAPSLDTKLYDNVEIDVIRVHDDIEVAEEIAPFDTVFVADTNLDIDAQQVVNVGAEGVTRTRFRVRYEDGQEVSRVQEDRWVAQEPAERVIAYGQHIAAQSTTTADGRQITYWRHIRMFASSYSASTAGVSSDSAYYGRTFTGDRMRSGIVAVDPAIIPLHSQVYVTDYGVGDALDTGSAIRARRIDLGYDDSNLTMWNRWVDVYLLWPPPPASEITWVLPNWPRPPD